MLKPILFLVVATALGHPRTSALPACSSSTMLTQALVESTKQHVAETSSTSYRATTMNLPVLAPSDVELVTNEVVCAAALQTYVSSVPAGSGGPATSVWVVRVGTAYLITEPTTPAGKWLRAIVVDSNYTKIAGPFGL